MVRGSPKRGTGVRPRGGTALTFLLLVACGRADGTSPPAPFLVVSPEAVFLVGVGSTTRLMAESDGASVTWTSANPGVAEVDAVGVVTAVATGTTTISARTAGATATAEVEVWAPPSPERYEPGGGYWGRGQYVEYVPGELPVVISAPHGGSLTPDEIPDRTFGTTVTDSETIPTVWAVRDALLARTGKAPHVVISHLRRTKLDPNREIVEAAQGNPYAENAWNEFQTFIDVAEATVTAEFGSGLYLDVHGHGHDVPRVELGYLLSASVLNQDDGALDAGSYGELSSIRAVAAASALPFSALLRGDQSFGAFLSTQGIAAVPSPSDPSPGAADYFTGGYNTDRHGSRHGGSVSGIQMELHWPGLRDSDASRRAFGAGLAVAVGAYMEAHWGFFAEPNP